MKISAVICSRNDNYGGNLIQRSTYCLNSMATTFDEVIYVDWNSPTHSLIYEIQENLLKNGKIKHICIPPEYANMMTNFDKDAQKCCEVLARNIGIRRATGDYIVSTNIDIIAPFREELDDFISQKLNDSTFYTICRRNVYLETISGIDYKNVTEYTKKMYDTYKPEMRIEKINNSDDYSIINCCGDFQIAHKNIWYDIRGFEESLIYRLYSDTNVQKKAVFHGYQLKADNVPGIFHISHGNQTNETNNKPTKFNDPMEAIVTAEKTKNKETWGFSDVDIEWEII